MYTSSFYCAVLTVVAVQALIMVALLADSTAAIANTLCRETQNVVSNDANHIGNETSQQERRHVRDAAVRNSHQYSFLKGRSCRWWRRPAGKSLTLSFVPKESISVALVVTPNGMRCMGDGIVSLLGPLRHEATSRKLRAHIFSNMQQHPCQGMH